MIVQATRANGSQVIVGPLDVHTARRVAGDLASQTGMRRVEVLDGLELPGETPARPSSSTPSCPVLHDSKMTLELSFHQRVPYAILTKALEPLGWQGRSWMLVAPPRCQRAHLEGPYSSDAIDLIRAAIPALQPPEEGLAR